MFNKTVLSLVAVVLAAGCGVQQGNRIQQSDEELFGLLGKGDGRPDVEAIRSMELSGFTADEIDNAINFDERVGQYLDEHPDVRQKLREAIHELSRRYGAVGNPIAVVTGYGYDAALVFGKTRRRLRLSFKTPSGSKAHQWYSLQGGSYGLQAGATYGVTVGLVLPVSSEPLTLRSFNTEDLIEVKASANPLVFLNPVLAAVPLTTAVKVLGGNRFLMLLADIGVGYHYGVSGSGDEHMKLLLEWDNPPVLDQIAE